MLCELQVYSKMIQLFIYIYLFICKFIYIYNTYIFFRFFFRLLQDITSSSLYFTISVWD